MKGYKITNCAQDKRIGVVGNSLNDVFTKGCQKLKVSGIAVNLVHKIQLYITTIK